MRLSSSTPRHLVGATALAIAAITSPALADPTFLITQGSTLYRSQGGNVQQFVIPDVVGGMTTVPVGLTVGNMNGGASAGDALVLGANGVYRLDDPFGTPYLTQIGNRGGVNASPVFVNGHLYGIGGVAGVGSVFVEWDTTDFHEISSTPTGVYGGPGGMVGVTGSPDEFLYAEFVTSTLWHYRIGDTFSTFAAPLPQFDYVGMERYNGDIYASFARPATHDFVFGTIDEKTGQFGLIRTLDAYDVGITGLTWIVPTPGSAGVSGVAGLVLLRRRRA